MKKKVLEVRESVNYYCLAQDVINQLQRYIEQYGNDNVKMEYYTDPYSDDRHLVIEAYRLETDDEYEKRIAHDKWYKQQQEDKEKELFAHLKAKYES